MISSTARDTVSAIGWSTAVSGGWVKRTIGVLSKLINDRSRGISSPRERATSSVASAICSLLTMHEVGGSGDRKSGVTGKSGAERVDLGGRGWNQTKKTRRKQQK